MRFPTIGQTTPGTDLRDILRNFAESALARLRQTGGDPGERIHGLRTDLKKLRSLLRLAEKQIPRVARQSLVKKIRTLKASCAGTRDEAVLKALYEKLSPIDAAPPEVFSWDAGQSALPSKERIAIAGSILTDLDAMDWDAISIKNLRVAFQARFRKGKLLMKRCRRKRADEKDFHAWRKRMKDLWYQAAALRKLAKLKPTARAAKKVSDLLGDANDLANLLHRVHRCGKNATSAELTKRLQKRMLNKRRKANKRGAEFFSAKPPF